MDSIKKYVVAVDIGSSEVTIAVGTMVEGGVINIETVVREPIAAGVTAGLIDNSQTVAEALRKARERAEDEVGVAITDAYVTISGKFVRCARYTDHVFVEDKDNCIAHRDLAALRERMCNVKATEGETIMDFFPLCYKSDIGTELKNPVGCYSKQLSATYNFILCDNTSKDRLRRVFLEVGIKIRETFAGAAIVADSLVTSDEKEDGVAIVDIGSGVTDVAIYRGGVLCYIASIPMGGSAINADILAYNKNIPSKTVENLKRKCGSAVVELTPDDIIKVVRTQGRPIKPIPRLNLAAVIEARMTDIVEYVWAEIREAGYGKRLGAGIVLTGGVANLKNVAELFHRKTEQEVRVACAEIGITTESLEKVAATESTLAVSLLLRGASIGPCPVGHLQRKVVEPQPAAQPVVPPVQQPATPQPAVTPTPAVQPPVQQPIQPPVAQPQQPAAQPQQPAAQPVQPPVQQPISQIEDNTDEIDDIEEEDVDIKPKRRLFGGWGRKIKEAISNAFPEPGEELDADDDY